MLMCQEVKNYRFVKNNTVVINEVGYRKLKSLKNPAIEAFYKKDNLDKLLCLLGVNGAKMRKIREANPCTIMQKIVTGQLEYPNELEIYAALKDLFPSYDTQEKILNTRSQILITALAWWANKIRRFWKETFGHEPENLFIEDLFPRMVA